MAAFDGACILSECVAFDGPNPHKSTSGPTVGSNAPWLNLLIRIDSSNTLRRMVSATAEVSLRFMAEIIDRGLNADTEWSTCCITVLILSSSKALDA